MRNYIISGMNLKPGDKVLLVAPEYMEQEDLFEMQQFLQEKFEGVHFIFLGGDIQVIGSYQEDTKVIEA